MIERRNPFQGLSSKGLRRASSEPLVVSLTRGNTIESVHRVHAIVKDSTGKTLHSWGNPQQMMFPRSAVKIMQALPFVLEGFHKKWNLGAEDLAVACSSHKGEKFHIERVQAWLTKLGLSDKNLECGTHPPGNEEAAFAVMKEGGTFCAIHNNCSGKHTGMLMGCMGFGFPLAGYSNFDHPYQKKIRAVMQKFFELDFEQLPWGIDGCGVPTYSFSIEILAKGMARLTEPSILGSQFEESVNVLLAAIKAAPFYFSGTDSLSSKIVKETDGKVFAKEGAEGVYTAWIPEKKLALALKVEDGTKRASEVAAAALIRELGYALKAEKELNTITNWSKEIVGEAYCT